MRRALAGALTAGLTLVSVGAGSTVASANTFSSPAPVTVDAHAVVHAPAHLQPGLNCLDVDGTHGETLQLAHPRHGGTPATLAADVAAFGATGVPTALERDFALDGGTDVGSTMCLQLHAGTYYALDTTPATVAAEQIATISVAGEPHRLPPPRITGVITAVGQMTWAPAPAHIAAQGTLGFVNASTETHFLSLVRYRPGKDLTDLRAVLANPQGDPGTVLDESAHLDTGAVSAGHSQTVSYALAPGRYAVLCFWPDLQTGVPHALMGMTRSVTVG